jgi:hypothetical protein
VLQKEIKLGAIDERNKEELRKVTRQERLANLRLHQREAQREREVEEGLDITEE